ncbi:ATP-dependent sacrificial sulfur transferase LarE [Corynebacterium tapiri]
MGVAFSGGVDSATLAAASLRLLGPERVVAILAVSPSLAARERAAARRTAEEIGVELVELEVFEHERPEYQANGVDRCYFCKSEMFERIDASTLDVEHVAYGENADDAVRTDRPGALAASEHGVLRPLAAAGLTKADVRALARELGLSVADKPAAPCLASRVPHGLEVVPEKLRQIEAVENALADLGFSDSRVRHHGSIARIEVPAAQLVALAQCAETVQEAAVKAGFTYAALDLGGMHSGAFTRRAMGAQA